MQTTTQSVTAIIPPPDQDEGKLLELVRRLGVLEAIEVVAAALSQKLAIDPKIPDADLEALDALEKEAFSRRQEARRAAE